MGDMARMVAPAPPVPSLGTAGPADRKRAWVTKDEEWEAHKEIIMKLYCDERRTALEVMEIMQHEYDFHVTYVRPWPAP